MLICRVWNMESKPQETSFFSDSPMKNSMRDCNTLQKLVEQRLSWTWRYDFSFLWFCPSCQSHQPNIWVNVVNSSPSLTLIVSHLRHCDVTVRVHSVQYSIVIPHRKPTKENKLGHLWLWSKFVQDPVLSFLINSQHGAGSCATKTTKISRWFHKTNTVSS